MSAHDPAMARRGEVIIEFYQVGAYVKVSAIDPATHTEVSIVGDPSEHGTHRFLEMLALAELRDGGWIVGVDPARPECLRFADPADRQRALTRLDETERRRLEARRVASALSGAGRDD